MVYSLAGDTVGLALPVEGVDFVELRVVEAVEGEVLGVAVDLEPSLLCQRPRTPAVEEVMVAKVRVVEQVDEQEIISDKAGGNEGVREVVDRHRVVAKAQGCVDVELLCGDLLSSPSVLTESPEPEPTVVEVGDGKLLARCVLLDLLQLDVRLPPVVNSSDLFWVHRANFLCECLLVALQRVLLDPVLPVTGLRHRDSRPGVVGHDAGDDRVGRDDVLGSGKPREDVVEVLETLVWLDVLI